MYLPSLALCFHHVLDVLFFVLSTTYKHCCHVPLLSSFDLNLIQMFSSFYYPLRYTLETLASLGKNKPHISSFSV